MKIVEASLPNESAACLVLYRKGPKPKIVPGAHLSQEARPGAFPRERCATNETDDLCLLPHGRIGIKVRMIECTQAQAWRFKRRDVVSVHSRQRIGLS